MIWDDEIEGEELEQYLAYCRFEWLWPQHDSFCSTPPTLDDGGQTPVYL
jgi:hypothetical protein